jgi:predicted AlkP superfamily pyrophosphatase or phosphodiesterase
MIPLQRQPWPKVLSTAVLAAVVSSAAIAAPPQTRPRLAVVIVVDQLSMGQIDRYEDLLGEGGLRRLIGGGTIARDARYFGAPTLTAHGHATLATGSYADHHGIVGNEWWEHDAVVHVGHDSAFHLLTRDTTDSDGTAPTALRAPTFADALRWSESRAHVVSISLKDRGAILFGGARPDAAIWYDPASDRWTTSTYYGEKLPSWVPADSVSGTRTAWTRFAEPRLCARVAAVEHAPDASECARLLYAQRARVPVDAPESDENPGKTFPHRYPAPGERRRGSAFMASPLADEALFDLATRAIAGARLGEDSVPDLLFVSASGFDLVGHAFGPESEESLDALLRLDAAVARLLRVLDEKIGSGSYVLALTADHGVQPSPAVSLKDGEYAGQLDTAELVRTAEAALTKEFGARAYLSPFLSAGFSYRAGAMDGIDRSRADAVVVNALRGVTGIQDVYPRSLFVSQLALRGDALPFGRSYFDGRSPDFIVLPRPLWIFGFGGAASHGTPYLADTRVPLIFFREGRSHVPIEGTIDVASLTPTLALILGIAPPAAAEAPILTAVAEALR